MEKVIASLFIELGSAIVGMAILARLAGRWGVSAIPLYLLAGLAFGNGGLLPLGLSQNFIHVGAEIGVLLLLFMLGLEFTGDDLRKHLRTGVPIVTPATRNDIRASTRRQTGAGTETGSVLGPMKSPGGAPTVG